MKLFGFRNKFQSTVEEMVNEIHFGQRLIPMQSGSQDQKEPYSPPTATKLTLEEAKRKLAGCAGAGPLEADDLLERLLREQKQSVKQT